VKLLRTPTFLIWAGKALSGEPVDDIHEIIDFHRLCQTRMSSEFARSAAGDVMAGHDDDWNRGPSASPQSRDELLAVHSGHHQIDQNQRRQFAYTQLIDGIDAVEGCHDPVTIDFEQDFDHFADVGIVVDDHHEWSNIGLHEDLTNGNSTVNVEPALG